MLKINVAFSNYWGKLKKIKNPEPDLFTQLPRDVGYKTFTTNKIEININTKKNTYYNTAQNFKRILTAQMYRCRYCCCSSNDHTMSPRSQEQQCNSCRCVMMSSNPLPPIFLSNENRWIRCVILACSLVFAYLKSGFVQILV